MLTQEEVEALETKYKRIAHVVGKGQRWECVFRAPTRAEYKRFKSLVNRPETLSDAQESIALATVVYPSVEAFNALLEDYPAIPEASASALWQLFGGAAEDSVKL